VQILNRKTLLSKGLNSLKLGGLKNISPEIQGADRGPRIPEYGEPLIASPKLDLATVAPRPLRDSTRKGSENPRG
jgi:hypothetical protein